MFLQNGGSHIDPELDKKYANMSRNNSLKVFHNKTPVNGAEIISVRQISFELLRTIKEKYPIYFE